MKSSPVYVVILAGGQGTRFWPVSRSAKPKQFLSLTATGRSLIADTVKRMEPLIGDEKVWVVTSGSQAPLVKEHVPNSEVLCEPVGRNTAASIGLAASEIQKKFGDAVMVVLPSDHAVRDEIALRSTLQSAIAIASEKPLLVTVGITPTYPHTGYGYILKAQKITGDSVGYMVRRFFEKPNFDRALEYVNSGNYLWNSGMFVWRTSTILKAIEEELPQLHEGLKLIQGAKSEEEKTKITAEVFEGLESISIDFGVLEHVKNCAVVPAEEFGWNDVGSWDAWGEFFEGDEAGNRAQGEVRFVDSKNCIVRSDSRLIAVLGGEDLVIIDSGDALLVCPRWRVQDVRKIVDALRSEGKASLI